MIGVHANLGGEIESHREARLALAEEIAIALVGFSGAAEAGVLAHGPKAAAVHGGVDAAGKRIPPRITNQFFRHRVKRAVRRVDALEGNPGKRRESLSAFGGNGGLAFRVRHEVNSLVQPRALQLPCPAERTYRKKHKQHSDGHGHDDEPASHVPRPGPQSGVDPSQRENTKNRSGHLVKKLLEHAPEATESTLLLGRSRCVRNRGHRSILTQNEPDPRKARPRVCRLLAPMDLDEGTVDGLETTDRSSLVSNEWWA